MVAAGVKLCRVVAAVLALTLAWIAAPALAAEGPLSKPDEARYRAALERLLRV